MDGLFEPSCYRVLSYQLVEYTPYGLCRQYLQWVFLSLNQLHLHYPRKFDGYQGAADLLL